MAVQSRVSGLAGQNAQVNVIDEETPGVDREFPRDYIPLESPRKGEDLAEVATDNADEVCLTKCLLRPIGCAV